MIWLNNVLLPEPTKFDVGIHRISRAQRSSSGRMMMETIAIKRAINLEYDKITAADLNVILNNLESRVFHILRYPDPQGGEVTRTVYTGDITQSYWYISNGIRYWEDVKIGLIEQ